MSGNNTIVLDADSDEDSDESVVFTGQKGPPVSEILGLISYLQPEQLIQKMKAAETISLVNSNSNSPEPNDDDCILVDEFTLKLPQPDLLMPLFAINEPLDCNTNNESSVRNGLDSKDYPCSHCNKIFYKKEPLQLHELEHYKRKTRRRLKVEKQSYPCQICSGEFDNASVLEWHTAECAGKLIANSGIDIQRTSRSSRKRSKD